ncbi:MAG: iron transporter [Candidatus Rokuibacteriota bacterium]
MTNVRWAAVATLAAVLGGGALAQAQHQHGAPAAKPAAEPSGSKRVTMEDLHRGGGVPPGWRFSWPAGAAARGREVFAKLECYQCHEVKSEKFPPVTPDPTRRGPELSGMGAHHPAEYFAESIINPNAVIVLGPGHTGPDGQSIMPDFRDSLTLAETIDLVAFIRSLGGGSGGGDHAHHGAASPAREQTAGSYRVRLAFHAPGQGGDHAHHQHGAAKPAPAGHLVVLVNDLTTGEPVPYLPISATIHADKSAPRTVSLVPMVGNQGFHYGTDVSLPAATTKITVTIGKPTMRVMSSASGRFARTEAVSFDWQQ